MVNCRKQLSVSLNQCVGMYTNEAIRFFFSCSASAALTSKHFLGFHNEKLNSSLLKNYLRLVHPFAFYLAPSNPLPATENLL